MCFALQFLVSCACEFVLSNRCQRPTFPLLPKSGEVGAPHFWSYGIGFVDAGAVCVVRKPAGGNELYQSMPRVKYMAVATARKLAIAPTSSALSSSRSRR